MSPTGDTCDRAHPWHCSVLTWGQRSLMGTKQNWKGNFLDASYNYEIARNRSESFFLSLLINYSSSKTKSPLWAGAPQLGLSVPLAIPYQQYTAKHPEYFVGQYDDFFPTLKIFFIFPLRMHNWYSVYQYCLHSCALLESFRVTGLQGIESWLGPLHQRENKSRQHRSVINTARGSHSSCNARVSSGLLCPLSALHTTPHSARALKV